MTSDELPGTAASPTHDTALERLSFEAQWLMAHHPPVLHNRNKQEVFSIACPAGGTHAGDVEYTRWPAFTLPKRATPAVAAQMLAVHEGVYDYVPHELGQPSTQWHVNFADPMLFCAYGSGLFAQDEMQVAEHPVLGALREALRARGLPTLTAEFGASTPVLVKGAERRCVVATNPDAARGRPNGLYGNAFSAATPDAVGLATTRINPPTRSNIIAMAAPSHGRGQYTEAQVRQVLTIAYSAFRAAVLESEQRAVVIHTGYWGCGVFGGNRVLMAMLQLFAAQLAGVQALVFHTVSTEGRAPLDDAVSRIRSEFPALDITVPALVKWIAGMGFRWGTSDGA
jgi:hypothetical protein